MATALYPGTFDPITLGHLDILSRATRLFDKVDVVVAVNRRKKTLFSLEERVALIRECVADMPNVEVSAFEGLTVQCLKERGAQAIVRGLRAVSDFEYEFQMALTNQRLDPACETVYLMPSAAYTYLNSTIVREIASFGGAVSAMVPASVEVALRAKLRKDS